MPAASIAQLIALCKQRGLVFQASQIYGGQSGAYDYGHYGVLLKANLRAAWWEAMIEARDDIVALDSAIIQHPRTWEASGHLAGFSDPMSDCKRCKARFRSDHLSEASCPLKPSRAAGTGPECELTEAREFNLMFQTHVGAMRDSSSLAYLRPETAQGIFLNFKHVMQSNGMQPPFGIAQTGKSFRNEITPGGFIFRTREFEQMETEFFCHPSQAEEWYTGWKRERLDWYLRLGLREERLRLREHGREELAHYALATADVEYLFPSGWQELEGIANRGAHDLRAHAEASGERLEARDRDNQPYVPYVIEPAAGADRIMLALLADAYREEELPGKLPRTVLSLHPRLAPVKLAVLPLVKRDGLPELAEKIREGLRGVARTEIDHRDKIGRRYRRQDQIGTPWCATVDYQSLEDGTVTLRERDSMEQTRLPAEELPARIQAGLRAPWSPPAE